MTLTRLGHGIGKWCWYSLAAALVTLALLVSLVRTLLPELDTVRQQLIDTIEQRYGIELDIARLGAGWEASGPQLTIYGLRLAPQPDLPISLTIAEAQLQLDFWPSLLNLSPYLDRVAIDGVELGINLQERPDRDDPGRLTPLEDLLLKQLGRLSIEDLTARVLVGDQALAPVYLASLNWKNQGGRHLGEGRIYLDEAKREDETLTLALELNRHFDGRLFGRAYLKAAQLDIGDWLARQLNDNPYAYSGVLNLEAWASLDHQGLRNAMVQFGHSALSWQHQGEQTLALESGTLQWQPHSAGHGFAGELVAQDLAIASNGEPWAPLGLWLRHQGEQWDLWMDALPAGGLEPLFGLIPGVSETKLTELLALNPSGTLGPLRVQQDQGRLQARLPFEQLAWHAAGSLPGLTALDGVAQWQGDWGWLSLPEQPVTLDWPEQFKAPIALDRLALTAEWLPGTDGGQLRLPELALENPDLALSLRAALGLPREGDARLQLYSDLDLKRAGQADNYFPRKAMGAGLSDYLGKALKQGHSDNAQVLWHGALKQFPYAQQQGVFQARFDMQDLEFDFLKDWPAVSEGLLEAQFENARMDLWLHQGQLGPVAAQGAHVAIPSLSSQAVLEIAASVMANGPDAIEVMADTNLAGSVGATLEVVKIPERVPVALDMSFPLGTKAKETQIQSVRGRVAFWDSAIEIAPLALTLAQTRGELRFHNSDIQVHGLQTRLYNQPSELSIVGGKADGAYAVDIDLATRWQMSRVPEALSTPVDPFLIGGAPLGGEIALRFGEEGLQYQAELRSNLVGLAMELPAPLGKEVETERDLRLAVTGDTRQAEVLARLGGQLEFHGDMQLERGGGFRAYQVAMGTPAALPTLDGGYLEWLSPEVALDDWEPLVSAFANFTGRAKRETTWFPPLKQVAVQSDKMTLYGLDLGQGQLQGAPGEAGWQLQVDSDNLAGQVQFSGDLREQGIRIDAEHFSLAKPEGRGEGSQPAAPKGWIQRMPRLEMDIAKLTVAEMPLGRAELTARPDGDSYFVERLNLTQGGHSLRLTGRWSPEHELSRSQFQGQIRSPDVGDLSQRLGITQSVKDSDLRMGFELAWPGAPWELELAELDGQLDYRLGKGHLDQMSDKGARLLSIFSLESLLRKLSLDFSDVFGSGLHYNRFAGSIQIDDGVVQTDDSVMDAVAGTVRVTGWTNLTNRELDYHIAFSPALTSSVPAVVFMSTGAWTIGLGAFAVSKMLEPVLEVITQVRYHLTGTLDEPVLNEVDRTKRAIPLPEQQEAPTEAEVEALQEAILKALDEPEAVPADPVGSEPEGAVDHDLSPDPDDQPAQPEGQPEPPASAAGAAQGAG
ncbi:YhdP family protein [Ferrimonas balearica]|uniref:YhdP family protein n=1 Tax=Ferrimonas balearica TaxID=44012 RepID=UPI001C9A056B|nr:YhdP family protein [Ferrimonas balearica]MBY5993119.1 TIGR02099 family protein [Ferrimonas balearica]